MRAEEQIPEEMSPSRYIEKVDLLSGEVLEHEIQPRHLLVNTHRDYHVADVQARRFMARMLRATGDEEIVRRRMKEVRQLGHRTAGAVARLLGRRDPSRVAKFLFGLKEKEYYYRFRKPPHTGEEIAATLGRLRAEASEKLEAVRDASGRLHLRVLLTGGTGFVGKELLWQVAHDADVAEVFVVIRPKTIRDRATGEVVKVESPAERGAQLLRQLWLDDDEERAKFTFVAGDVEEAHLGIADEELRHLERRVTHVVHSAASVSFDDPYLDSFRANVSGTLNALRFSRRLQRAAGSPFVAHVGIETSYIHGRQVRQAAREDEVVFPRNFYNNYYELTKAIASLETERFMLDEGLRVVQLCPAIVIGESRAGNNRGDQKVVNAPVNVFGRAHQALQKPSGNWVERSKASVLARMACIFPGDPSAELNLIPVDRVVEGIRAALRRPEAIGARVHLATDNRITSEEIRRIVQEEVGVEVRLAEPTIHRVVTLPVLTRLLTRFKQERLAGALEKLGTIFSGYSEWGQPVHEVGKDATVLGLSEKRPDTRHAFRMLCRHNRYVQDFGKVRDLDEISRRERVWLDFVCRVEERTGEPAGGVAAADFHRMVEEELDLARFELRDSAAPDA